MARRNHRHNHRPKQRGGTASSPLTRAPLEPLERKAPVTYGQPFIVLEDEEKNTFVYNGGKWIGYEATIAECRVDCQVKVLPQKINGMTRYEVSCPV